MDRYLYSLLQRDLVYDWTGKWFELCDLVNSVIWIEQRPFVTCIPTEVQEKRYQGLHFWFVDHQEQFLPLWRDFTKEACCEGSTAEDIEAYLFIQDEFIKNPFCIYFGADNLYRLIQELDSQSGMDIQKPNSQSASEVITVMMFIGKLLNGFIDWMDERV